MGLFFRLRCEDTEFANKAACRCGEFLYEMEKNKGCHIATVMLRQVAQDLMAARR